MGHRKPQRAWLIAGVVAVAVVAAGVGGYLGVRGHLGGLGAGSGAQPPARSLAAMAYDDSTHTVVMFGGIGPSGATLGDTWTWDGSGWTQQHPAHSPPSRELARMTFDPASHDVLLFGGEGGSWAWGWSSQVVVTNGGTATAVPPRAVSATSAPAPAPVYGPRPLNDTWLWDGSDWKQAGGAPPGAEANAGLGAGLATDPASGQVLLVATSYALGPACPQPAPPIHSPGLAPCPGPVHVVGDLAWTWSGSAWQTLHPSPPSTGIAGFAAGGALVADPRSGHVEYFRSGLGCGGWSGYQPAAGGPAIACPEPVATAGTVPRPQCCTGSVSMWTGSSWASPRAFLGGPNLFVTALAADPGQQDVVALAGGGTWTWNGSAWSERHPGTSPGALAGASLAFDGAGGRVLVFGGVAPGGAMSAATWAWDGSTWALVAGTAAPAKQPPAGTPAPPVPSTGLPNPPGFVPGASGIACPGTLPGTHPGQDLMPACPS